MTASELPPADDPAVAFLAADQAISISEARERIRWQEEAVQLEAELRGMLGPRYGGMWSDPADHNRIKLGVVGQPADISHILLQSGLSGALDQVPVAHSMAELEAANLAIRDALVRLPSAANQWPLRSGIRPDLNKIVMHRSRGRPLSSDQQALLRDVGGRYRDMLLTEEADGPQILTPDACIFPSCDAPLRGGILIDNDRTNSNGHCTTAFNARSRTDAKWYALTAGHCRYYCGGGTWESPQPNLGGWYGIGPFHNWEYGDTDAGILRIDNLTYWDPRNWVMVYEWAGPPATTRDAHYYINKDIGISSYGSGYVVCATGAASATTCGYVQQMAVNLWDPTAQIYVFNLVTASYCPQGGDSGGPVYKLHTAYGIHSGHIDDCLAAYAPIRDAETAMNVNVWFGL